MLPKLSFSVWDDIFVGGERVYINSSDPISPTLAFLSMLAHFEETSPPKKKVPKSKQKQKTLGAKP